MINMNKSRLSLLLIVSLLVVISIGTDMGAAYESCSGIWSAGAKSPYPAPSFSPTDIPSPNGAFSIKATQDGLLLGTRRGTLSSLDVVINPPLMEVLWSPNSQQFVINVSDGGLVGTWEAKYYLIDSNGQPVSRDIQKSVKSVANSLAKCESKEEVNIGAASWLNDGKEILLVVEVPPHSSCRNMGTIWGFRVSVKSGKVIERISENHLRRRWPHSLGCRLRK